MIHRICTWFALLWLHILLGGLTEWRQLHDFPVPVNATSFLIGRAYTHNDTRWWLFVMHFRVPSRVIMGLSLHLLDRTWSGASLTHSGNLISGNEQMQSFLWYMIIHPCYNINHSIRQWVSGCSKDLWNYRCVGRGFPLISAWCYMNVLKNCTLNTGLCWTPILTPFGQYFSLPCRHTVLFSMKPHITIFCGKLQIKAFSFRKKITKLRNCYLDTTETG